MSIIEQSPIVDPANAGIEPRYENFIAGTWVPPTTGEYRDNVTPATGRPFTKVPYSGPDDVELALDAGTPPRTSGARRRRPSARTC